MQIHELPTFTGTPGASDYFAVDNGSITAKVAGSDMVNPDAMTVAEANTGTSTASRIVTPKVVHDYVTQDSTHLASATISAWATKTGNDGSIDDMADYLSDCVYVIESGTSGNWRYRKWSDGTAECWMNKKATLTVTSWGSLYYVRMDADSYPTGLFTEVITVVAQFASSIDMVASARNQGNGMGETLSTTTPPGILGIRPTTASAASYTGMWYAIGKWK